jgi:DNA-directed RNA polymerase specialized sigma24 family protein
MNSAAKRLEHSEGAFTAPRLLKPSAVFPDTHWSVIAKAGERDKAALAALCGHYWYPVYGFLRGLGASEHEAADSTQGLFTYLLERSQFAERDPLKGRFRSWLRTCARNYHFNRIKKGKHVVDGEHVLHVSIDSEAADSYVRPLVAQGLGPDQIFDRCWARTVAERAVARLREECVELDKSELALNLIQRLCSDAEDLPSDAELSLRLERSREAIRVERHRTKGELRRLLTRCLQAELLATVDRPDAIESEIAELIHALLG